MQKKIKTTNFVGGNEKKFSTFSRIRGFVELMRPLEWGKTLFCMALAVLMAHYVFGVSVGLPLFAAGFGALVLLWSGLYALNDWTDWKSDLLHKSKHIRSIPSGRIKPRAAFVFSIILIAFSFLAGLILNNTLFLLCMAVMLVNQFAYTLKPFRLKERKYFDIISGAFINPIFRYLSGLFLFVSLGQIFIVGFPVLPLFFIIGIQAGTYLAYRFSSKGHDAKLKLNSSISNLTDRWVKVASRVLLCIALYALIGMLGNDLLLKNLWLGFVPLKYVLALIPGVIITPMLMQIIKAPKKATDPKTYKKFYVSFHIASDIVILFVLIILFFFP